jgi:hypothetical protein
MEQTTETPLYSAVADDLRTNIGDKYHPGDLLPSEADLSAQYNVHRHTVRHALDVLSRENLIRRHRGRGSIVLDRKAVGEFAIVISPRLLDADSHPFYGLMNGLLIRSLHELNPRWQVKFHIGKDGKIGTDYPATLDLLAPDVVRNLRGVFSHHPLYEVETKLASANVPVVNVGLLGKFHVGFDLSFLHSLAVTHLRDVGCKTVGMIWAINAMQQAAGTTDILPRFQRAAKTCELEISPEWTTPYITNVIVEQHGYETMMRLWKSPSRPDGILVIDDVLCRGVLRAALQLGIEFPRDIRLVTYANRGVVLHYHKSVTRVEYDPMEQSRLIMDMMMTLVNGKQPVSAAIDMPGMLIKGETT